MEKLTCKTCGKPRSYGSAKMCRTCYTRSNCVNCNRLATIIHSFQKRLKWRDQGDEKCVLLFCHKPIGSIRKSKYGSRAWGWSGFSPLLEIYTKISGYYKDKEKAKEDIINALFFRDDPVGSQVDLIDIYDNKKKDI